MYNARNLVGRRVVEILVSLKRRSRGIAYGTFVSRDAEEFTFYDVDRKIEVKLGYVDLRKIKDGYARERSIAEDQMDRVTPQPERSAGRHTQRGEQLHSCSLLSLSTCSSLVTLNTPWALFA